ncbi:hypothetical protein JCM17823_14560 [Halorubrum gandharaense]
MTRIRAALTWLPRQLAGAWRNFRSAIGGVSAGDVLPPWIATTLAFIADSLPKSMGFTSEPVDQVTALVTWCVALIVASAGILTIVAVGWAVIFGPLALLRFVPAVERRWPVDESSWRMWRVR